MHDYSLYVEINPKVMLGKPVIKGTRINVERLVEELAAGYGYGNVLKAHPHLSKEDILAAVGYTAATHKNEQIRFK